MNDKSTVLLVGSKTYRLFGNDFDTPGSGDQGWTLEELKRKMLLYGLYIVSTEDKAVLDASIKAMSGLADKDLEEGKDDEVMGELSTAELARRKKGAVI